VPSPIDVIEGQDATTSTAPPAPPSPRPQATSSSPPSDHHRPFGGDRFGILAERFARFFGTPNFILGQTALVAAWILLNALVVTSAISWDKYPFIALNLLFSLQAAYAAPLILLAQTRQADRDHLRDEALQAHREAEAQRVAHFEASQAALLAQDKTLAEQHAQMLAQNTDLTREVAKLTAELHAVICRSPTGSTGSGRAPTG
jgi:uncharacterized membrane protein